MARGLSSSVKTELATGVIDPVLLLRDRFWYTSIFNKCPLI